MGRYSNKYVKYLFIFIVMVFAIILFNVHDNTLIKNTFNSLRGSIYEAGWEPDPTVTIGNAKYYDANGRINDNSPKYANKISSIQFDLVFKNLNDYNRVRWSVIEDSSGLDITDKVNVSMNGEHTRLIVARKNEDFHPGSHTVKISIDGVWGSERTRNFYLDGKYYNIELQDDDPYEFAWGGNGWSESAGWNVKFKNPENIDMSKFSVVNAKVDTWRGQRDYADKFYINDHWLDWNGTGNPAVQLATRIDNWWGRIDTGLYTIVLKYSYPEYSNARGDLYFTFNLFIGESDFKFDKIDEGSYRLSRSNYVYSVTKYKNEEVTILPNDQDTEITIGESEFETTYGGVDLNNLVFDTDGSVLYRLAIGVDIKKVVTVDDVTTVYFYIIDPETNNKTYTSMEKSLFIETYGDYASESYVIDENGVKYAVAGFKREYETISKSIRAAGAGKFTFVYDYDGISREAFDDANVTISTDSEAGTVYKRELVWEDWWNSSNKITVHDPAFTYEWHIDTNQKKIYVNVIYDSSVIADGQEGKYIGNYEIKFKLDGYKEKTERFQIVDAPVDFFVASSANHHESSDDPFNGLFPPSNKDYEYDIALRMIKGDIDPYQEYDEKSIDVDIFTKRIDVADNQKYFYDQIDYTVIIDNYKNNIIKYRVSTDVANSYEEKNYTSYTETLNGSSQFETKYTMAYEYIRKGYYVFDADGNIDRNTDNIPYSIYKKRSVNKVDYLTYRVSPTVSKEVIYNKYIDEVKTLDSNADPQSIIVDSYQMLDYSEDGDVNVGVINGFYTYGHYNYDTYKNQYEVSNLFDVTINPAETSDIDHAIKILPKTEVPAGEYYVYVYYNAVLPGIGYINNGFKKDNHGNMVYVPDEIAVSASLYPENWNRNIHMTSIKYDEPVYDIQLDYPKYSNTSNDQPNVYYNIPSQASYEINPKFIYNYDDISYRLEYTTDDLITDIPDTEDETPEDIHAANDSLNWSTVNTSDYTLTFSKVTENYSEEEGITEDIEDVPKLEYDKDYTGKYRVNVNTKANMPRGNYRLVVEYTNPENGISLKRKVYEIFNLSDKYYGLILNDDSEELEFPHNYQIEKTAKFTGEFISTPGNIEPTIFYSRDGVRNYLTRVGNTFINEDTNEEYFYIEENKTNNPDGTLGYTIKIKNNANVAAIGRYGLEVLYHEEGYSEVTTYVNMEVTEDQYFIKLENEYPRATDTELSFAKDLTTMFISESAISDIAFTVYKWSDAVNDYVDVSSPSIATANRHITDTVIENLSCDGPTCTARVRFYLNKRLVEMDEDYFMDAVYDNKRVEEDITDFSEMFGWDFAEQSVTSRYDYEDEHGVMQSETVNGFYKNLQNIQIKAVINNDVHQNNIKYSINQSCITDDVCNPTTDAYSDLFDVVNTTGENQTIILTPKRDAQGNVRIPNGKYALVLYYETSFYRIIEFDVHSEFAFIEFNSFNPVSKYIYNGIEEDVEGIYTGLSGTINIDTTVKGVGYDQIDRYVINAAGRRVNEFMVNTPPEFKASHISTVTYSPSVGTVPSGVYTYVAEYVAADGDKTTVTRDFEVYEEFFDFEISGVTSNPDPPLVNRSGELLFNIVTKNIKYLTQDEHGDQTRGRVNDFAANAKMYDLDGNDVTNMFTFEPVKHQDTLVSGVFDIRVKYTGNTLEMGNYKFETSYTLNNKTVTKYYWVLLNESDKFIIIDGIDIESNTPDNKIHNSHGGTYVINFTANTERAGSEMDVQVTSADQNVTDKFTIVKADDNVRITFTPSETNTIEEGDYNVVITYGGNVDNVRIHMYGVYVPIPPLESNADYVHITYGDDPIVYVSTMTSKQLKKNTLITKLKNIQNGFKILDKNGNDITSSTTVVGTGMTLVNPGDRNYKVVVIGDLNQDGSISLADVALLFQHVTGSRPITDHYRLKAADIRKKDNITLSDVAFLFQFATGARSSI